MKEKNLRIIALALFAVVVLAISGCRSSRRSNRSPSWSKATILSEREDHPSKIVADGEAVYYVTGGTIASLRDETNNIKRISLKDGNVSVLVKGGDKIPGETLAVDEKYLYWSDGGSILRVPKTGGASEKVVANASRPDEIVMDNDNIYWLMWAGEGSPPLPVMYAARKGGEAKPLTPPQTPTTGLCVDGDFVFFMTGAGIKKIPRRGGEITEMWHNPSPQPSLGLQHDKENFYFAQMNSRGHAALMKLNKTSGELTQLAASINHTMEFLADGDFLYYFADVPKSGSFGPVALLKVSKHGGDPVTLSQGESGWLKHLAIDSKQVYFTDISKVYALPR